MLFAFLHELGHLISGLLLGFNPQSLGINPLGLSINFKIKAEDYNERIRKGNILAIKKLIIASSGPLVNFILAFVFNVIEFDVIGIEQDFLVYSNILIGIFNLIPIYPLDGGRVLKNI
ncbi:MAG: site-2 protease family protein, partial [Clostridia bacterium]|nr:site-2 protease family protein [Clostridia bacterium]